jgi:hypothetical protein
VSLGKVTFKALQHGFSIDLWETNHVTVSELLIGSGALAAHTLKGAAVRLFKHPCPVPYCLLIQRVS